jgi:Tfp pilus assembly protein PilN
MTKKNETTNYIPRTHEAIQLILTIASVVTVLAGLWLTTRLAPFAEDISLLKQQIKATDQRQTEINTVLQGVQSDTIQIKSDVSEIKGYLKGKSE